MPSHLGQPKHSHFQHESPPPFPMIAANYARRLCKSGCCVHELPGCLGRRVSRSFKSLYTSSVLNQEFASKPRKVQGRTLGPWTTLSLFQGCGGGEDCMDEKVLFTKPLLWFSKPDPVKQRLSQIRNSQIGVCNAWPQCMAGPAPRAAACLVCCRRSVRILL